MKKNIYFLGLLLFAACANDDEPTGQQVQNTYPLTIEVTENPLIPDGEEGSHTRAAIVDKSTLNKFYMSYGYSGNATYSNMEADKSTEGKWTTTGSWPGAGDNTEVTWYASSVSLSDQSTGNAFYSNNGDPYISFSVDENAAATKDLLVAKTSGTWNGTNGNIAFTFDHACAALRFEIKKSTNLDAYTVSVSNVKLCKVLKSAKYFWSSNTWVNYDTPTYTEYTLFNGALSNLSSTNYEAMNAANDYLFFIPQTLTAWTPKSALGNTYLEIICTITKVSDSSEVFNGIAYMPFGLTLVKGYSRTVKLNIGKNSLYSDANTKIITE